MTFQQVQQGGIDCEAELRDGHAPDFRAFRVCLRNYTLCEHYQAIRFAAAVDS